MRRLEERLELTEDDVQKLSDLLREKEGKDY